MIGTSSVHMTTSVFVPDHALIEAEVLRAAERVTRRRDDSVILAIQASTIDVTNDEVLAPLEPALKQTLEALTRASISPDWVHTRQGILNIRIALWPDRGPLHAMLPLKMLTLLSPWRADIYLSVSRTADEDNDLTTEIHVYLSDITALMGSDAEDLIGRKGQLSEPDAILRQQSFERQIDRVMASDSPVAFPGTPPSTAVNQLVVEFGTGSSDSGIVLTAPMIKQLASVSLGVLFRAAQP